MRSGSTKTEGEVRRRDVLRGAAAMGSVALAGCLGLDRSDEIIPAVVGTWRGDLAIRSESTIPGSAERTGYDLSIHALTVDPATTTVDYDFGILPSRVRAPFRSAWVTARYQQPRIDWAGMIVDCTIDSSIRSAQIDGEFWHNQHDEAWFVVDEDGHDLFAEGTLTLYDAETREEVDSWRWRSEVHPLTDDLSRTPRSVIGDMHRVVLPLSGDRIDVEDVFEMAGPNGMGMEKESVVGTLYRVTTYDVELGSDVDYGEPLETDERTRYTVTTPSGDEITMDAESKAVFERPPTRPDRQALEQFNGVLRAKVDAADESQLEIRQPVAIAGVRGTEFVSGVESDGTCFVSVLSGEVEYADREGRRSVTVGPNQTSQVVPGGVPTPPETVGADQIPRWWE